MVTCPAFTLDPDMFSLIQYQRIPERYVYPVFTCDKEKKERRDLLFSSL